MVGAPLVAHVVAVDVSSTMLELARLKIDKGHISNAAFCEAAAKIMPFEVEGFSLTTCRSAAYHFVFGNSFLTERSRLL